MKKQITILIIGILVSLLVGSAAAGIQALPAIKIPLNEVSGDGSFQTIGNDVSQSSGNQILDMIRGVFTGGDQGVDIISPEQATINNTVATVGNGYQEYFVNGYSINIKPIIDGSQFQATNKDKSNGPNKVSMISDVAKFDYQVTDGQFKENITLTSPHDISFEYTLSDGKLEKNANGTIWVNTSMGPAIQIERPYAIDNTGKHVDLDYNINGNNLDLIGNIRGLQYPIVIDPTFTNIFIGGSGNPNTCRFSINGQYLVIGSSQASPYLYQYNASSTANWTSIGVVTTNYTSVNDVAFSGNSTYMAAATSSGSPYLAIYQYNASDPAKYTKLPDVTTKPAGSGLSVAFTQDNTYLAVGNGLSSPYLKIYQYNASDPAKYTVLPNVATLPSREVESLAFSNNSQYLAIGFYNSSGVAPYLYIYAKNTSSTANWTLLPLVKTQPAAHPGAYSDIAFSPDNNWLAFCNRFNSPNLEIYKYNASDTANWTRVASDVSTIPTNAYAVAFSGDSTILAVGQSSAPYVSIYQYNASDPAYWTKQANLTTAPTGAVRGVAFLNNSYLATTGDGNKINIYSMSTAIPIASFTTNATYGILPLTVLFNDTSTNTPTSWLWQWGDGTANDTFQNGTHTFSSAGTYQVNLTASNPNGSNLSSNTIVTSISASVDQSQIIQTAQIGVGDIGGTDYIQAQSFIPNQTSISGISFYKIAPSSSPTGNLNVSIRPDNSGKPSATILSSTELTLSQYNLLSTGFNYLNLTCSVTAGSTYWIVFKSSVANEPTGYYYIIGRETGNDYSRGSLFYSTNSESTWTDWTFDSTFKTWYLNSTTSPVASFTSNVSAGYPAFTVQFNDTSLNIPTSWNWSFGDGQYSTIQNATHTYQSWIGNVSSSYNVSLNATNSAGSNVSVNQTKTAYPLTSVFTSNLTSGKPPLTVQFNTTYGNGTATNWSWNFGDTGTSTDRNATHTYSSVGTYTVTLNASNAYSYNWSQNASMITVNPLTPPAADFHANRTTGYPGDAFLFTDDSTNTPTSWQWYFGDSTSNATTQNPVHTYSAIGTYSVTLTTTNADGSGSIVKTNYITISEAPPSPPAAAFSGTPTTGYAPISVSFTDSSAGAPYAWYWIFGDGNTSTLQNPNHTYSAAGTYDVKLEVTNAGGSDWENKTGYLSFTNPPAPVVDFSASPLTVVEGHTVTFTDASTNSPMTWAWDFGDGTSNGTTQNPTHIYSTTGSYNVTLTASNLGGSGSLTKTGYITVSAGVLPNRPQAVDTLAPVDTMGISIIETAIGGSDVNSTALNLNYTGVATGLAYPYTSVMGPIAWVIAIAIPLMVLFVITDKAWLPLIVGLILSGAVLYFGLLPAEFAMPVYGFAVISIVAILASLFLRR